MKIFNNHSPQVTCNQQIDSFSCIQENKYFSKSSISSSTFGSFIDQIWQGCKSFFCWIFSCFGLNKTGSTNNSVSNTESEISQQTTSSPKAESITAAPQTTSSSNTPPKPQSISNPPQTSTSNTSSKPQYTALPHPGRITNLARIHNYIWFYKKEENPVTAFLGNFHPCELRVFDLEFQCAEAAFQAVKFSPDLDTMSKFCKLDGEAAWRLGRELTKNWTDTQKKNWGSIKSEKMAQVLYSKFAQNPDLKELLLATKNAYLLEHNPVKDRDNYWSDDFDGTGRNMLGLLLMVTRGKFQGSPISNKPSNIPYTTLIKK